MKNLVKIAMALLLFTQCAVQKNKNYKKYTEIMSEEQYNELGDGLYAQLKTNKGDMLVELYEVDAPLTVANFVGLAEGTKENEVKPLGEPYYNGTKFHRVIKNFMLQGGDPQGTGAGGPGYSFKDEKNDRKHTGKGVLSMANAGPNTNGSQFFITEVATPWLDGKHTIFGRVISGENVIDTIANVETAPGDRPKEDVVLEQVNIIKKGPKYEEYNAPEAYKQAEATVDDRNKEFEVKQKEKAEAEKKAKVAQIQEWKKNAKSTDSGLQYVVLNTTDGASPKKGDNLSVHYTGMLEDGTVFDSSYARKQPIDFPADSGRMIKGWDEGIMLLKEGEKAVFFIPSDLGYGERGAGGVIPPNADLVFELELVNIN